METLLSQTNGEVLVVYFSDTNLVAAPRIEAVAEGLKEQMNRAAHGKLLLNFQAVRAMASSMLGKLVKLKKECDAAKIDLKLCALCEEVGEAFEITRLDRMFDIHPDRDTAVAAFHKKRWFR